MYVDLCRQDDAVTHHHMHTLAFSSIETSFQWPPHPYTLSQVFARSMATVSAYACESNSRMSSSIEAPVYSLHFILKALGAVVIESGLS